MKYCKTQISRMIHYFVSLSKGKVVLWCYLIWYIVTIIHYFDPSIRIWLNSLGISLVIGFALMLSASKPRDAKVDFWQTFRLFMMPFCVSSFSSLIKGQGYILIIPPNPTEQLISIGACMLFVLFVYGIKLFNHRLANRSL
ncbi:hypothetical protein [Methylomicrobium sp. Wu6]|uniref:hypothetical protein n=1 Tax=Methylomicrobium sp. Wu6 TaxID=3107928 RepID=UPI002DD65954|nr:hypothetical protein [Methylomicrobium sp. Wu6]MEC4746968.1 hypothetical protein [Methylomicrobium sp. Wu6]